MAEPKDNLNPEEVQQIEALLSALNKNPLTSEELNPMARVLREKLGYTEPAPITDEQTDEETNEDGGDPFGDNLDNLDDDGLANDDLGLPPVRNIEAEDDDIDLDELLNEGGPTKPQTVDDDATPEDTDFGLGGDDPFGDLPAEPISEEEGTETTPPPTFDDDPFADLGGTPTPTTNDDSEFDFAPPAESTATEDEAATDPFADFDSPSADDDASPSDGTDPFADLGSEPMSGGDDPFADLGGETTSGGDDPFASMDSEEASSLGDDPFGDLGNEPATNENFSDDPFASLDSPASESPSDAPVADFDDLGSGFDDPTPPIEQEPDAGGFDDPFGDLGVGMEPPGLDDDLGGGSTSTFDDFAPSLDDMPVSSMETADDFGSGSAGFDDELSSLGKEDEPAEDLDAGLEDEDLAIIQRELVKYPPKLRRTIIDTIVNNRIPVKNQKEIIELIKAQQKPEDVANFLGTLLGERVELSDTSGKFAADGVPIIASRDAYTKEGAIRRRELIRKTFLSSAAAILLFVSMIGVYKYIILPHRAGAQYEMGLEKIEEFEKATDVIEKTKLLAEAESFFAAGEREIPFNLEYLNKYCDAYLSIGQYDKAFEKCFGKVEPDFGMEPADKNHVRSWENRKEVPNISLIEKTTWDDNKLDHAGRKVLTGQSGMSLVSQDGVPRKIIKAGAYIASRLKYNIHDVDTYLALGKFHSFNRRDFIEIPPGSSQKRYKNDPLAIEYFKRVFTDAGDSHNVDATAGIAKIYYNKREFGTAVKYYNDIIESKPKDPIGHGGILSTYIEMWKRDHNPQYVLNHHRQVRNALDIESDLSPAVLAKLAAFYIDLDSEDVRIKYNINPEDQVSGMEIDDNVEYLLNIIYGKEKGNRFAEGFYQRARFYFKKEEAARALKQLELAATYDSRHYLAVLLMAEYYMKVENMTEAQNLLAEAQLRYNTHKGKFGEKPEDETLIEGKPGRIDYNLGKIAYLESVGVNKVDKVRDFPGKKIYPERSLGILSSEEKERRQGLNAASEHFKKALEPEGGIEVDSALMREINFYLGWIDYNHAEFAQALDYWSRLPEEDIFNSPTLLLGKGNAYYYTKQYNASLGNYLKLKDDYEELELSIGRLEPENSDHQEIFQSLTALYNNIGAVYEKKGDTINALKYYWKAMETARRIGIVSEIATSNKDLVFARIRIDREPLLEDWLPPTLDKIKDMK